MCFFFTNWFISLFYSWKYVKVCTSMLSNDYQKTVYELFNILCQYAIIKYKISHKLLVFRYHYLNSFICRIVKGNFILCKKIHIIPFKKTKVIFKSPKCLHLGKNVHSHMMLLSIANNFISSISSYLQTVSIIRVGGFKWETLYIKFISY